FDAVDDRFDLFDGFFKFGEFGGAHGWSHNAVQRKRLPVFSWVDCLLRFFFLRVPADAAAGPAGSVGTGTFPSTVLATSPSAVTVRMRSPGVTCSELRKTLP